MNYGCMSTSQYSVVDTVVLLSSSLLSDWIRINVEQAVFIFPPRRGCEKPPGS